MSKITVRLIHWNDAEAVTRVAELRAAGFNPQFQSLTGTAPMRKVIIDPPNAYVIDLSRLPSHGRDVGLALRQRVSTRAVPLIFVDGDEDKVERLKRVLPDATYTTWPKIKSATTHALKSLGRNLVVPPTSMAGYSGTPLPKKLGIKPNFTVALHDAPADFTRTLGDLPEGANLVNGAAGARQLTIYFVRSMRDLRQAMPKVIRFAHHGPVWIASPKKASGVQSDVNQNEIRNTCLSSGLVDYKVCAIDATWSGLLFCLRKQEK